MLYINDNVYIAGLTGMSGAGKTTACEVFAEQGFKIIDCDSVARDVVQHGRPALSAIAGHFTDAVLQADGTLDRKKLGGIVFNDGEALQELNDIIYPYITFDIIGKIIKAKESGSSLFLLDAPTLFESGADKLCDTVVCVTADREHCLQRITERDKLTPGQAEARLSSQHDALFYTSRSRYSAVNDGSREEFVKRLCEIAEKVKQDAGGAA